ncbi:uncharacterized protein LOC111365634 [Olea europaea var. sylvestris]|uniref:uncharacterized protein LOC111365634 n=1 Tax=Olea europaea var. sylvestris TaxID=158386 RepID=UPI000C1D551D|nr:uncharacterized protein LOC111365634 [Olea europaea var. sylvestris]
MKVSDGTESILSPNSRSGGDKLTCYRSLRRRRKGNNDVGRRGSQNTVMNEESSLLYCFWVFCFDCFKGSELNSSMETPNHATEGATTKWECGYSKVQIATFSVASALQVELVEARNRIKELEAKRMFSRMKLESFTRKLDEERASWIRREHQKMSAIIKHLKESTIMERRKFQKVDILKSKLLSNLADSKKSAKQFVQNYEREKKAKVFLQDVCTELAKEIEKEKAEIVALKRELGRVLEKVEEEKNMLQMVEAWHEERVQVTLVNAKLILEEKYSAMSNIIAELQTFLRSTNVNTDMSHMTKKSQIELQSTNEFSHTPPKPDYIHTIVEGSRVNVEKGREMDRCIGRSPTSHSSRVTRSTTNMHSSDKETMIQAEDQNSSYNLEEFEQSANDNNGCKYISSGKPEDDHFKHHGKSTSSALSKKPKKKGPPPLKLWRSFNDGNAKLLNASSSNVSSISQDRVSGEGAVCGRSLVGHRCQPDPRNPHIVRGMQGRIEWRRGIQRRGLRAEGLETRILLNCRKKLARSGDRPSHCFMICVLWFMSYDYDL